jgi:hypothetical protein
VVERERALGMTFLANEETCGDGHGRDTRADKETKGVSVGMAFDTDAPELITISIYKVFVRN